MNTQWCTKAEYLCSWRSVWRLFCLVRHKNAVRWSDWSSKREMPCWTTGPFSKTQTCLPYHNCGIKALKTQGAESCSGKTSLSMWQLYEVHWHNRNSCYTAELFLISSLIRNWIVGRKRDHKPGSKYKSFSKSKQKSVFPGLHSMLSFSIHLPAFQSDSIYSLLLIHNPQVLDFISVIIS